MRRSLILLGLVLATCLASLVVRFAAADDIAERARKLHFSSIVVDTHDDTTQRFFNKDY